MVRFQETVYRGADADLALRLAGCAAYPRARLLVGRGPADPLPLLVLDSVVDAGLHLAVDEPDLVVTVELAEETIAALPAGTPLHVELALLTGSGRKRM